MATIRGNARQLKWAGPTIGPCVAISLSEAGTSTIRWTLDIAAKTRGGSWHLGVIFTIPPANVRLQSGGALLLSRRVVGIAYCPGAFEWYVAASATQTSIAAGAPPANIAEAELELTSNDDPKVATAPGVWPIFADTTIRGASGHYPEIQRVETLQIAAGGAPVQLLPEDLGRARALVRNQGAAIAFVGPDANTTAANGYQIPVGAEEEYQHHRQLFVITGGAAATLSVFIEHG